MRRFLALAFLLVANVARADGTTHAYVSAPLIVGVNQHVSVDSVTDFIIGARPELIIGRAYDTTAWGFGPYGEALDANGDETWFGGGLTGVFYKGYFGVALSGGVDARVAAGQVQPVPAFGAFFGVRIALEQALWHGFPFDLPLGIRVDTRIGYGMIPTSIAFQFQLDVIFASALLVALIANPNLGK